jgi:hypothetical protein
MDGGFGLPDAVPLAVVEVTSHGVVVSTPRNTCTAHR